MLETHLSFTSLTVESGSQEEPDSSLGVGLKVGPRFQHAERPFGVEANVGGNAYLGEWDFGFDRKGGRFGYTFDVGFRYRF